MQPCWYTAPQIDTVVSLAAPLLCNGLSSIDMHSLGRCALDRAGWSAIDGVARCWQWLDGKLGLGFVLTDGFQDQECWVAMESKVHILQKAGNHPGSSLGMRGAFD